ncbi:Hypothetical protein PHPALM_18940 [Phytophthora palmivora]|uniref:Uncharacterized protein n=1 Tax=Phytophthora palmivora TaxID=4796 RepID=A0A2P4XII1_9STRA|nr:Hypothetical protein PHPALM_18940 [Phytophthora palmivora]
MEEEDASEFDVGGGSAEGRSPSPDQASTPPSKDVERSRSSGEVIEVGSGSDEAEKEEEEDAEVVDDLYEAQTLMAISQSRSEARRRDHASPNVDLQPDPADLQVDPMDRTPMRDPEIRTMDLAPQADLVRPIRPADVNLLGSPSSLRFHSLRVVVFPVGGLSGSWLPPT